MILCHPQIETVFDFSAPGIPSVVIEEPVFFRTLMLDLYDQINGESGKFILSENDKELNIGTWVELIDNCLHFSLNTKPLINKIVSAMEQLAVGESFSMKTAELLQQLEQYAAELAFNFDCDILCEHCTAAGLFKAVGISLRDEYDDPLERLIDYMELIREFDRDKVFILINLRSFFADDHVENFLETISAHGYHVLLLDSIDRKKLPQERRVTIDNDLCEF